MSLTERTADQTQRVTPAAFRRVLVVDDDPLHRELSRRALEREGLAVEVAESAEEALARLREQHFDAVVSDYKLPGMTGLELLQRLGRPPAAPPLVLVTALGDQRVAAEALKAGAQEYVVKDVPALGYLEMLPTLIQEAIRRSELLRENARLREQLQQSSPDGLLVGRSAAIRRVLALIEEVAPVDSTVLITGESGTGKELVARAIHRRSPRASGPFVVANCAALPESLLESELFGHEAGAFTGARAARKGRFERANGGTLFLDELGDIPPKAQVDLLRVLQEREFERVGGTQTIRVDVRIIAATNRDLQQLVREGKFREDLYYRVNVIPIHLPPLRERPEDIAPLAYHFLRRFARRFNKPIEGFTARAMEVLTAYAWPGNVRELENLIERVVVLCRADRIDVEDLPSHLWRKSKTMPLETVDNLELVEKLTIERVVRTSSTVAEAARRLGISRTTLYAKMRKYGLDTTLLKHSS